MEFIISKCKITKQLSIFIETNVNITKGSFFKLEYEDSTHYFEVNTVETLNADYIIAEANEVGYWPSFFKDNFDIRELIYEKVTLIKDDETIKKINKESRYC